MAVASENRIVAFLPPIPVQSPWVKQAQSKLQDMDAEDELFKDLSKAVLMAQVLQTIKQASENWHTRASSGIPGMHPCPPQTPRPRLCITRSPFPQS